MDLSELTTRTGIDRRKLRYVLDHALIPELHIELGENETGRPRRFANDVGFAIVCAARLLDLGLPHAKIQLFLRGLLEYKHKPTDKTVLLTSILGNDQSAYADCGDAGEFRIRADGHLFDWVSLEGPKLTKIKAEPFTIVTLNLGAIRDQIFLPNSVT